MKYIAALYVSNFKKVFSLPIYQYYVYVNDQLSALCACLKTKAFRWALVLNWSFLSFCSNWCPVLTGRPMERGVYLELEAY